MIPISKIAFNTKTPKRGREANDTITDSISKMSKMNLFETPPTEVVDTTINGILNLNFCQNLITLNDFLF